MLDSNHPTLQDIEACVTYCKNTCLAVQHIAATDITGMKAHSVLGLGMGVRHLQRTSVDAVVKTLRVIALDVDRRPLSGSLEKLLESLSVPTAARPIFIGAQAQHHMLLAKTLALHATLPILPLDPLQDWEERKKAAKAHVRTMDVVLNELERIHSWMKNNLDENSFNEGF
jgi:hypothetical protein